MTQTPSSASQPSAATKLAVVAAGHAQVVHLPDLRGVEVEQPADPLAAATGLAAAATGVVGATVSTGVLSSSSTVRLVSGTGDPSWLEQGRDIQVSANALERIVATLLVTDIVETALEGEVDAAILQPGEATEAPDR